jgi:hypothetical protein
MQAKEIWKKSAAMAASSPGNIVTGALGLVASAALWNPLPLILWGLGSATFVTLASTSEKYSNKVIENERKAAMAKAERDRDRVRGKIIARLQEHPFAAWISSGALETPLAAYPRLVEVRNRLEQATWERADLTFLTELGIVDKLNSMLNAYLEFVWARLLYLQLLWDLGSEKNDPPPQRTTARGKNVVRIQAPRLPTFGERIIEINGRIAELRDLAKKEPATATAREWHAGILEKQRDLLTECEKRDMGVAAQLEAFPDAFEMILGRFSTPQIDPEELSSSLSSVVDRVEETGRLVESLRPAVEDAIGSAPRLTSLAS